MCHPWCKFQLHSICRIWDARGWGCTTPPSPKKLLAYNKTQNYRRVKVHEKSCTKLFHSFAINMEMVQMEFWTTSRKMVLGGSVSMIQEVYQHFQSIFGICFTAQVTSFQEQITQLRGDTEGSKYMFLPVILCFGSFLKCSGRRKLLLQWEFYKTKVTINLLHKEEDTLIATSISLEL